VALLAELEDLDGAQARIDDPVPSHPEGGIFAELLDAD
jgi:hypothetical protein